MPRSDADHHGFGPASAAPAGARFADGTSPVPDPLGEDAGRLRANGIDAGAVERAALALVGSLAAGGMLLTFGNGGSAADAQHVTAELIGRFEAERRALPAVALTTDSSALTAIANDYGFERVFARQVEGLGRPGDVALAISTSGSSANVLAAVRAARERRMTTVGLCGAPGCALCLAVDVAIAVPAGPTAAVQEAHLIVEHALCRAVDRLLFGEGGLSLPMPGSVVALDDAIALRKVWKAGRRTVVWTNGCFDVVHAGHLATLEAAKAFGDVLVVGVNDDAAVRRLKGQGRPLIPAAERAAIIAALAPVDYVVVFAEDTPERMLDALRPDVHVKGADYAPPDGKPVPERALVEAYGGRLEFIPLVPARSSSSLIGALEGHAG
jgi:rfaE bifunctional protein nucleotidyltransferase chain/domain